MTTLTSSSSPELAGPNWVRIVALYGIGPFIAVVLVYWLMTSVSADQRKQLEVATDTKALIEKHVEHTHEDLERIVRLLEVGCENEAKTPEAKRRCRGVGR